MPEVAYIPGDMKQPEQEHNVGISTTYMGRIRVNECVSITRN